MTNINETQHEFDWNIESYQDRMKFIEESNLLEEAEKNNDTKLMNKIAIYLLRAKDIESNRKIEKSFYITKKEDKKIHKEWVVFSNKSTKRMSTGNTRLDETFELIIYNVATVGLGKVDFENIYNNLEERHQTKFLKYINNINLEEYKKIDISIYLEVKEFLTQFYCALNEVIENDVDAMAINLLLEGRYQKEIADELNVSTRVIQGIIKRIFRNMKKVL